MEGLKMARGPNIDQDELFEAANRLEAEGKEVTAQALLTALGRGSYTTVYKHLDAWKASRPAPVAAVSMQMPDPVKNIFASAWRMAVMESAKETEAVRAKASEDIRQAAAQFQGALDAIEKLEKDAEESAKELASANELAEQRQAEIVKVESNLAGQKATCEELRHQLSDRDKENSRLREELEKARQERDSAMREAAEMKGRAETLLVQNEALLKRIGEK